MNFEFTFCPLNIYLMKPLFIYAIFHHLLYEKSQVSKLLNGKTGFKAPFSDSSSVGRQPVAGKWDVSLALICISFALL